MAFNEAPNATFSSWSEDATNITLPIASVTGLTAAEADGATGDIREVIRCILNETHTSWQNQATPPTLSEVYASSSKSQSINNDEVTETYTFKFVVSGTYNVKSMPTT